MKFFTPSFFQLRKVGFVLIALFAMTTSAFAQNATNGGQIAADQTVCPGEAPDPLTSNAPASGGDENLDIEYLWMVGSSTNFPVGYVNAPGANNGLTYNPQAVGVTSYFIRCARRAGFTQYQAESNIVVISVLGAPNAVISNGNQTIYRGATIDFEADYSTNSTYSWDFNGNGFPDCFGQNCSFTYNNAGTFFPTLTVTNGNGCAVVTTVEITVLAPTAASLIDPCCGPGSIPTPTAFYSADQITVYSNPGETWTYTNGFGAPTVFDENLVPIPNGTVLIETQPGVYTLPLWFNGDTGGWMGSVSNGFGAGTSTLPAGPGAGFTCVCANPLPVDLISFDANTVDTDVELKWATASESNNSHFELERSLDGVRFEAITKIDGAGNSSTIQTYSFMDKDALAGTNYYRLTQVDFDGTSESFAIVTAKIETGHTVLHVLPNPVKDIARVRLEGVVSNNAIYTIVNTTGQVVKTVEVTNIGGIQEIDLTNVQAGVYYLNVVDGSNEKVYQKIIKQ